MSSESFNNTIYGMIAERGWSAETAIELVLEYLRQRTKTDEALDVLVGGVLARDDGQGLVAFLQDCVMTGTDRDVAEFVRDRKIQGGSY